MSDYIVAVSLFVLSLVAFSIRDVRPYLTFGWKCERSEGMPY